MVAIIDYGSGNIFSLCNAVKRAGFEHEVTSDTRVIQQADKVILPGVGEASEVMREIENRGIRETILNLKVPVLGICIGMQVLCSYSSEGDTKCLGVFPESVQRLRGEGVKIPHMGWNRVNYSGSALFEGIKNGEWFYFVHSFAPESGICTEAVTDYGVEFASVLANENFFGTQFHPEKSGSVGDRFLKNFLTINLK